MPMYRRRIICLANSYKHGGSCIAGRSYVNGVIGEWIRPVSVREGRELSAAEQRYSFLRSVSVGDICEVDLARPAPMGCQKENHEIAGRGGWRKLEHATWTLLYACQDVHSPPFWIDMGSSTRGIADRVPIAESPRLGASLQLIHVPRLELRVQTGYDRAKKEVRASFAYEGQEYVLKVTDPVICGVMKKMSYGTYPFGMALLCVSVSEPYKGFVYRLVATLITPRRCESFR